MLGLPLESLIAAAELLAEQAPPPPPSDPIPPVEILLDLRLFPALP